MRKKKLTADDLTGMAVEAVKDVLRNHADPDTPMGSLIYIVMNVCRVLIEDLELPPADAETFVGVMLDHFRRAAKPEMAEC